jgi:hypothetical protein
MSASSLPPEQDGVTKLAEEWAIMDFMGAIATATKAIEGLKLLMSLEKTFDEASFKLRIADITSNLADLKTALTEAKSEAAEKDAEIVRLKKEFAFAFENTIIVGGFRYEKSSRGNAQGMPFCPRCEKVDGRLINLAKTGMSTAGLHKAICPQCKSVFGRVPGYRYDAPNDPSRPDP